MRLDLYQQETERLACDLQTMLDEVRVRLQRQEALSALERYWKSQALDQAAQRGGSCVGL